MVEGLAARLKQQPDDAAGWAMLGRSYMAMDRPADALLAFQNVLRLKPNDAGALADLADTLAVTQGSKLDGEPTRLIEQALAIDPNHLKALALAGAAAYNRGDFKTAVRHWDRVVQIGPADQPMVEQARQGAISHPIPAFHQVPCRTGLPAKSTT
jgi:cytochrome c-type biogenesis protein CcmH